MNDIRQTGEEQGEMYLKDVIWHLFFKNWILFLLLLSKIAHTEHTGLALFLYFRIKIVVKLRINHE